MTELLGFACVGAIVFVGSIFLFALRSERKR